MTIKQRALLDTLKYVLGGALVGAAISVAIEYLGTGTVFPLVALAVLAFLIKVGYDVRLSQLRYEQERIQRALKDSK